MIIPQKRKLYDIGSLYWSIGIAALHTEMARQLDDARPFSDYDRLRIEVETFINIPDLHVTDAMIREHLDDRPCIQQIIDEVRNAQTI